MFNAVQFIFQIELHCILHERAYKLHFGWRKTHNENKTKNT